MQRQRSSQSGSLLAGSSYSHPSPSCLGLQTVSVFTKPSYSAPSFLNNSFTEPNKNYPNLSDLFPDRLLTYLLAKDFHFPIFQEISEMYAKIQGCYKLFWRDIPESRLIRMDIICVPEACYWARRGIKLDHEESRERGLRMDRVVTTFSSLMKYSSISASIAKPAEHLWVLYIMLFIVECIMTANTQTKNNWTKFVLPTTNYTHSSVLAWRIPGTGEPGGLPSMGSHRVGHDWSDLAAAAAATTTNYSRFMSSKNSY